ncbi:hypothetical protein ZHAS_00009375 [Anopheles sinensis]|uniref:Uncharacterized protein n=1 Tax=Anopheles sinensis TaxID=74873 RepID=A0A084VUS0_ANOSI|nr:hypothetical protein ZHAS_00009375 [Anopheles sinensis]
MDSVRGDVASGEGGEAFTDAEGCELRHEQDISARFRMCMSGKRLSCPLTGSRKKKEQQRSSWKW